MTRPLLLLTLAVALHACSPATPIVEPTPASRASAAPPPIRVNLLQINDVYEIVPSTLGGGGGLARVAALRDSLLRETPNTFTVLAGDFLSPSAIGTARVDGERLNGRQMVDVLNAVGLNYATYGNHEFDLDAETLRRRLDESGFVWLSSNVTDTLGAPLFGTRTSDIITVSGEAGSFRMGLVAVTIADNDPGYAVFRNPLVALREAVEGVRARVDAVVALTHVDYAMDVQLASDVPGIDLILGGHEHENIALTLYRNGGLTRIAKADANARSAYVHRLTFDPEAATLDIVSELVHLDASAPQDSAVDARARLWIEKAYAGFRSDGFDPAAVVACSTEPLDGREAVVRNAPTTLTERIVEGMHAEVPDARLAFFNSGSIRIDDVLPAGVLTQYDILRILPFQGRVMAVDVPGRLLIGVLQKGAFLRGTGGFLQVTDNVSGAGGRWSLDGEPIALDTRYRIAVNDYLAHGLQPGLEQLNVDVTTPGAATTAGLYRDLRRVLIDVLRDAYPMNENGTCAR